MCKISLGTNFVRSTRRKKKDQYKTVFYSAFLALDNNTLVDVSFLCKYQSNGVRMFHAIVIIDQACTTR